MTVVTSASPPLSSRHRSLVTPPDRPYYPHGYFRGYQWVTQGYSDIASKQPFELTPTLTSRGSSLVPPSSNSTLESPACDPLHISSARSSPNPVAIDSGHSVPRPTAAASDRSTDRSTDSGYSATPILSQDRSAVVAGDHCTPPATSSARNCLSVSPEVVGGDDRALNARSVKCVCILYSYFFSFL